ncbi:TetR/AcrR family transcriptional regulator [Actinomadura atramentaria]|uniref:TetR/AcrR family transcriptional regulator n=1 Tax=Actinomadura atramentaria TaxID=1990 RepID=UPI0003785435|nr:TetR/AcrR family transcriptional regulator [Actinomadura atramentaria]
MNQRRSHTGRRRNEAARRAILDAAVALLGAADGTPVTIDTVAAAAGVGKQTIYRWWPSKGAVLLDALAERAAAEIVPPDTGDLAADLAAFVRATFETARRPGTLAALRGTMAEALRDAHAGELMRAFAERRRAALRAVLDAARARGEIRADADLELAADQVFGVLWYRCLVGHAELDAASADRLAAAVAAQLRPVSAGGGPGTGTVAP